MLTATFVMTDLLHDGQELFCYKYTLLYAVCKWVTCFI